MNTAPQQQAANAPSTPDAAFNRFLTKLIGPCRPGDADEVYANVTTPLVPAGQECAVLA